MRYHALAVLLLSAGPLAACGGSDDLSRNFGVARDAPSATSSMPLVPLSVPPTLNDRPSRPGAAPAPALRGQSDSTVASTSGISSGQQALVDTAGGGFATPTDIRQQIDEDTRIAHASPQFVNELMNWSPPPGYQTVFQQANKSWWNRFF